ncbi:uncharacterized protein LOC107768152 isoform X1 [Nicotiana tabacum]|uniref:Uncharacterized protein LOC107768152 isoform X1 n=1 Tax=Nicotiana tabacum TaxID=4097 RepID=A0AC58TW20_TOBAC
MVAVILDQSVTERKVPKFWIVHGRLFKLKPSLVADGAGLVHQMQDKHCNLLTAGSSTFGVVGHGGHLWWSSLEVMKVSVCAVCDEGMSGFHSGSAKTVFLEIFVFLV